MVSLVTQLFDESKKVIGFIFIQVYSSWENGSDDFQVGKQKSHLVFKVFFFSKTNKEDTHILVHVF